MIEWVRSDDGEPVGFEDFVSLKQAAQILRVSDVTLRRWIAQGQVRAYRFGGRIRLRRADLQAAVVPARAGASRATTERLRLVPMSIPKDDADAVAQARELQKAVLKRRHGKPLPEAWEDINEAREERSAII